MYDDLQSTLDDLSNEAGSTSDLTDNSYLGTQISDLQTRIDDKNKQLNTMEDEYYQQFSKMEAAINQYNSQASYLSNFMRQSG